MNYTSCLLITFFVYLHLCYISSSDESSIDAISLNLFNVSEQNATNYHMRREIKKLMRLQFIRNRIFNHLRLNKSLDYDDGNEATSTMVNSTDESNDFILDPFSDSESKFSQIIPILNLTSFNSTKFHDFEHGDSYQITSRCLRGLGKIENITSLLTSGDTSSKELQLYFPLPPFFRKKTAEHSNSYESVIKKATMKLYKRQMIDQPGSYFISIFRYPIMSWMKGKSREGEIILINQQIKHDYIGWLHFDLSNFYFGPNAYSKLVNSLIIVNASDSSGNLIEVKSVFAPTNCDHEASSVDDKHSDQPFLELGKMK